MGRGKSFGWHRYPNMLALQNRLAGTLAPP